MFVAGNAVSRSSPLACYAGDLPGHFDQPMWQPDGETGEPEMSVSVPGLTRSHGAGGEPVVPLGMPLVDDYVEFLGAVSPEHGARCRVRPEGVLQRGRRGPRAGCGRWMCWRLSRPSAPGARAIRCCSGWIPEVSTAGPGRARWPVRRPASPSSSGIFRPAVTCPPTRSRVGYRPGVSALVRPRVCR